MKLKIQIFLLFINVSFCFSQENEDEKFPSTEEENYYKKNKSLDLPIVTTLDEIRKVQPVYVSLKESPIKSNPFKSIYEPTPYELYIHKIRRKSSSEKKEYIERVGKFNDSLEFLKHDCGEFKNMVLREDSMHNKKIVFYESSDFLGYGVAVYENNIGWKKYYTGLISNKFYYVKPKSKIRLIINDSIIQIEIAIVRKKIIGKEKISEDEDQYKLLKDNLVMQLNLSNLTKDSDKDGLPDIIEEKFHTNPFNKDTDNDGLNDDIDSNPLYKDNKTKYDFLYKRLLNQTLGWNDFVQTDKKDFKEEDFIIGSRRPDIYTIRTENSEIKNIHSTISKYIFLSEKEYLFQEKLNIGNMNTMEVSPLFKVDDKPDYYKIHVSGSLWGEIFLIIEKPNGFVVKCLFDMKI